MNVLIVHQNFPGQYVYAARWLVEQGHAVVGVGRPGGGHVEGVRRLVYPAPPSSGAKNEFVGEVEQAVESGLGVARLCEDLKREGFTPDLVLGHNGWGEILFIKEIWPSAPLLGYFEFYYRARGGDLDFDAEFPPDPEVSRLISVRNTINLLGLERVDCGQTATSWQKSLYPPHGREKIEALHEGVDVDLVRPDANARMFFRNGLSLGARDPVITYCARNLEPYRGFHVFMRALPRVLRELPDAQVLIAGGDHVSYGRRPEAAPNWRERMLAELGDALPSERVRFLGVLPYRQYLSLLQISSAHVYLTYPFVLSWSFVDALAAGCFVVASKTEPVAEFARDGENCRLVDFHDVEALSENIIAGVRDRQGTKRLRQAARNTALGEFDRVRVTLPRHVALWRRLTGLRRD